MAEPVPAPDVGDLPARLRIRTRRVEAEADELDRAVDHVHEDLARVDDRLERAVREQLLRRDRLARQRRARQE